MVTGGRDYPHEEIIRATFDQFISFYGPITELVVGDATGADSLAKVVAMEYGIPVRVFYADWKKFGKCAGSIRNGWMIDTRPDFVLPFPGGRGTADAVRRAKKAKIPLFEYRREDVGFFD
jgi:hypothetical protein